MHWKFEPFFSIEILHGKYPPPAVGQPASPAPVFLVEPTAETRQRLKSLGWVFKSRTAGGGGTIYAEKLFAPNGTTKLRAKPAKEDGFSFLLRLSDTALLRHTKPYDSPNTSFPAFSGRARILYFDNLNAVAVGQDTFSLTSGAAVSQANFAARIPTSFMFRSGSTTVAQVEMTPLEPGGATQVFLLNPKTHSTAINLPEKGYRLTQKPENQSETLYLTNETLPTDTLGIVRIFQPPNADWEPFRQYQIMFDKV